MSSTRRFKWRLIPLAGVLVAAAAMLFLGGNVTGRNSASATGLPDLTSVTCADVELIQLQTPIASQIVFAPGTVPPSVFKVANSITRTDFNTVDNTYKSSGSVYNIFLPGIIAGPEPYPIPPCARIDKQVGAVTGVSSNSRTSATSGGTAIVTDTAGVHPPLVNMIIYWDSTDTATQQGFWVVTAVGGGGTPVTMNSIPVNGLAVLGGDPTLTQACNGVPASAQTAPGVLRSCAAPTPAKLNPILAFSNVNIAKSTDDDQQFPSGTPRTELTGSYDKGTGVLTSISCAMNTGKVEDPSGGQNEWTRTEVRTKVTTSGSLQVPNYGVAVLYNPTFPVWDGSNNLIACNNIAPGGPDAKGQVFPIGTRASTNATIVWPLDSALPALEGAGCTGTDAQIHACAISNFNADSDSDGCRDWDELAPFPANQLGTSGSYTGGRDPQNPNDCARGDSGISGIYNIEVTAVDVTLNKTLFTRVPGAFFHCRADIQDVTNNLTTRLYCYTDAANPAPIVVNPPNVPSPNTGATTCPPAPADQCGDGFQGSSSPTGSSGPPSNQTTPPSGAHDYGDVDSSHVVITGTYNPATDEFSLAGCYTGVDNTLLGPNVYVRVSNTGGTAINAASGHGTVDLFLRRPDCTAPAATDEPMGPLAGTLPGYDNANIQIVKLASRAAPSPGVGYDFDQDGCPDVKELGNTAGQGGLRDPYNPYDYFNPTLDHQNRVDDILKVVHQFFKDYPTAQYTPGTDRTALVGGNAWNLGPGNGQQRVDDILAAVKQFFHDC